MKNEIFYDSVYRLEVGIGWLFKTVRREGRCWLVLALDHTRDHYERISPELILMSHLVRRSSKIYGKR